MNNKFSGSTRSENRELNCVAINSPEIHLFVQLFNSSIPERNLEIKKTLFNNLKNRDLTKIHLFLEGSIDYIPNDNKIVVYKNTKRMTYYDFFKFINDNIPLGIYCIVANNDIEFKDITKLGKMYLYDVCICLSRWDSGKVRNTNYSQDSWIFQSPIKIPTYCKFFLGIPGCDNRIAYELLKIGYSLLNIPWDIISIHNHRSMIRNYNGLIQQPYAFINPEILKFRY